MKTQGRIRLAAFAKSRCFPPMISILPVITGLEFPETPTCLFSCPVVRVVGFRRLCRGAFFFYRTFLSGFDRSLASF